MVKVLALTPGILGTPVTSVSHDLLSFLECTQGIALTLLFDLDGERLAHGFEPWAGDEWEGRGRDTHTYNSRMCNHTTYRMDTSLLLRPLVRSWVSALERREWERSTVPLFWSADCTLRTPCLPSLEQWPPKGPSVHLLSGLRPLARPGLAQHRPFGQEVPSRPQ
jgi:hypothetical protein